MITIKLNLTLIKIVGKRVIRLNIQSPKKLSEVINEIGILQSEVGMVIINGRWAPMNCIIEDNDEIQLFPHLEGG